MEKQQKIEELKKQLEDLKSQFEDKEVLLNGLLDMFYKDFNEGNEV